MVSTVEYAAPPQGATVGELRVQPKGGLWLCRLVIGLLVFTTFSPALKHGFLPWDDHGNITRNPHLQVPLGDGLARLWTASYDGLYIPLVYTTFAVETRLAGGDEGRLARIVHFDNLLLHALCALIVFELLRRLFEGAGYRRGVLWGACAGALLFALHPLQAEPVNWATGRKDLLAGCLALAALWQYGQWRRTGRSIRYGLALACFALAMLAKPAAAAVPLALLALDFLALGLPLRRSLKALAPWFALAVLFAWATARIQQSAGEGSAEPMPAVWTRPFVAADALAFYMEKLILPRDFSPVYTRPVQGVVADRLLLFLALPLVAVPLGFLLRRRNMAAAGTSVAVAFLLPTSGLVSFHYQSISTVADRYAYLALFGVAVAAGSGLLWLGERAREKWFRVVLVLPVMMLIPLAAQSWRQSAHWRDSESLWTHAVRIAPASPVVRNNLGMTFGELGRTPEAEKEFAEAVRLKPGFAAAHNNLGNAYADSDRQEKAAEQYRKAVEADPRHVVARANLMVLLFQSGGQEEAAAHARHVLESDPDHLLALNITAISLGMAGKVQEALTLLRDAHRRKPDDAELKALLKQAEEIAAGEA